jgi:hypothetical protein
MVAQDARTLSSNRKGTGENSTGGLWKWRVGALQSWPLALDLTAATLSNVSQKRAKKKG